MDEADRFFCPELLPILEDSHLRPSGDSLLEKWQKYVKHGEIMRNP
jgi:hypothetical protein